MSIGFTIALAMIMYEAVLLVHAGMTAEREKGLVRDHALGFVCTDSRTHQSRIVDCKRVSSVGAHTWTLQLWAQYNKSQLESIWNAITKNFSSLVAFTVLALLLAKVYGREIRLAIQDQLPALTRY
jgi:hypothetical protein